MSRTSSTSHAVGGFSSAKEVREAGIEPGVGVVRPIPIGVLGEILSGTETGRFVEVLNDSNNTGGFHGPGVTGSTASAMVILAL